MSKGILGDRGVKEKPQKRRSDFTDEFIGFDFGSHKIQIQKGIVKELLEMNEAAVVNVFRGLCRAFSDVCLEHHIKVAPLDLFILVDDELGRGASAKYRDEDDGSFFAEILIPARDFKVHEYWKYTFLHELGHLWSSMKVSPKDIESGYEDLLVDLVAICTFRKTLPPYKRVYREVRKHRTYFLTQQSKRFLGKELYKQILQDPEAYLRDLRQKI